MTIAIGVLASDGIVIAADSQVTIGEAKVDQSKWRAIYCSDANEGADEVTLTNRGSCIVAGAGQPDGYLYDAADQIIQTFQEDKTLTGNELRSAFQQSLSDWHQMHVVPYVGLQASERPSVDLLIGYGRAGRSGLWRSDYSVLTPVSSYYAVGIGKPEALALLETLYRMPRLGLAATAVLASLILYRVKQHNVYCGSSTDIVFLREHAFWWLDRARIEAMETAWRRYGRTIEAANVRQLLSAPLEDEAANREELHRVFAELTQSLHRMMCG